MRYILPNITRRSANHIKENGTCSDPKGFPNSSFPDTNKIMAKLPYARGSALKMIG